MQSLLKLLNSRQVQECLVLTARRSALSGHSAQQKALNSRFNGKKENDQQKISSAPAQRAQHNRQVRSYRVN